MLILRLTFILLAISSIVLFGCYLLFNEQKYLYYCKQIIKLTLYLMAFIGIVFILRRLL